MKAAVFHGPNQPLKIEVVPTPKIESNEILVKVAACGVCHTDLHYIEDYVPTFKEPPLILGHESSGIVEEVGKDVVKFKKGDRVLLPAILTCGSCHFCRTGRENICTSLIMFGNNIDGAYAEYVKAPAQACFQLPEEIPLKEGAIIADAISSPYHAVKWRAKVDPGDTMVVYGCGGIGINVVQIVSAVGGLVIAIDISEEKLKLAKKFGAVETINPNEVESVVRTVKKFTGSGADIAIEAIGSPKTIEEAFECIHNGGRLCIMGYSHERINFIAGKIMYNEIEIVGSLGCRPIEYPTLIEMVRVGKIEIREQVTHRFALSNIMEAFEVMKRGESLRSIVIP